MIGPMPDQATAVHSVPAVASSGHGAMLLAYSIPLQSHSGQSIARWVVASRPELYGSVRVIGAKFNALA